MIGERQDLMEKVTALCKRRGFVFQSSEIYGRFLITPPMICAV